MTFDEVDHAGLWRTDDNSLLNVLQLRIFAIVLSRLFAFDSLGKVAELGALDALHTKGLEGVHLLEILAR